MWFFKSKNETNIRAQFKNKGYFAKAIEDIDETLKLLEYDKKYIAEHGALTVNHYLSYSGIYNKKAELLYCLGRNIDEIKTVFIMALDYFSKGFSLNYSGYSQLIDIVSKSVLFDVSPDDFQKIKSFMLELDKSTVKEEWKPDTLVFYLIGENKKRDSKFPIYKKLYGIVEMEKIEAEKAIKKYLEGWYKRQKNDPMYDGHLRSKGYSGYWSWEAAAVVVKMKLDDNTFKDNPYYPYDLVHGDSDMVLRKMP